MRVLHEEVYPARADAVPQARRAAEQAARGAGMCESQLENLRVAVSEAITNAVVHADAQTFRVTVMQDGLPEVHVVVRDEGGGLQPRPDSPGLGLGLSLIAQLSNGFTVSNGTGTGTEASMRFTLDAGRRES